MALGVYFTIWMVNFQEKKVLCICNSIVALYTKCTRALLITQTFVSGLQKKKVLCIVASYTKCTRAERVLFIGTQFSNLYTAVVAQIFVSQ